MGGEGPTCLLRGFPASWRMKLVVACIVIIAVALVGLVVLRFCVLRDSAEITAAIRHEAEERRMNQKRQKVRDWLAAAEEVKDQTEQMRRQGQHLQWTVNDVNRSNHWAAFVELPSISELELGAENLPHRASNYSLEPCALWQRQMEKLRQDLGLPPLPEWN